MRLPTAPQPSIRQNHTERIMVTIILTFQASSLRTLGTFGTRLQNCKSTGWGEEEMCWQNSISLLPFGGPCTGFKTNPCTSQEQYNSRPKYLKISRRIIIVDADVSEWRFTKKGLNRERFSSTYFLLICFPYFSYRLVIHGFSFRSGNFFDFYKKKLKAREK